MTVLVAKQKINAWTPIKKPEDLFVPKEVPEGTFSPKCITDLKDLKNQALQAPLNEEMPVTKDDLLSEQTAGLVAMLKNGERAVAIRVTPESLAGGFVLPGSKVDIVFTKKRGDGDSNGPDHHAGHDGAGRGHEEHARRRPDVRCWAAR